MIAKQKNRLIFGLIAGFAVTISSLGIPGPTVSALTDKEIQACANKWGGRSADPDDEQFLDEAGFKKFKASACAKGEDPACSIIPARRAASKYIACQVAGDGKNVEPSETVVAAKITEDNYTDYTNAKIKTACKEAFSNTTKQNNCIAKAKAKRDELKKAAEAGESEESTGDGGLTGTIEGDGCGGVQTSVIKCGDEFDNSGDLKTNGVWGLLILVINILTAGVGILAVGGIVYGAVLYTTAEDKADQVKQATDIITNVVIGLIAFALMWAGLNFIVPGGIFN